MIHLDAEELYISAVASVTSCIIVTCSVFCRNKKIPLWSLFLNCLFTFTMECGAYSNNDMSSRSSFTK